MKLKEILRILCQNFAEVKAPTTEVCLSDGLWHTFREQTASERNRPFPERKYHAEKDN